MRLLPLIVVAVLGVGLPPIARAQDVPAKPPTAGPMPLGIDGQLASWLQVRGEFRTRIEGFTGGGPPGGTGDAYWMDRFRLNVGVRPSKSVNFLVQVHDARAFEKTAGGQAAPFRDTFDLRQAYGELLTKSVNVRAGRQELAFGEQRLIGNLPWTNAARSFDALRATWKSRVVQVDAFAASVVAISPDAFDRSGNGNALYGAYAASTTLLPKQTFEPYFFWRQASNVAAELGGTATRHQATTGVRIAGKLPAAFDYSSELAVQGGSVGPDRVTAWAGHALVGRTFGASSIRPRLFGEVNYASGDDNRTDGSRGTFDQLYPTGHDKYGLADLVGWRNMEHVRAGAEFKPAPKWGMNTSYHTWWLASASDGLYSASGALVARSPDGTAGTHVGHEIDAQATYVYSPQLQIAGGYAYVIPGTFLKNTTTGQAFSYPFVMITYVFLGETPPIAWRPTR